MHEYPALSLDHPGWTVWVKHAWASFGLLEVQFPSAAYVPLALAAVAAFALAGWALARGSFALGRPVLALFGLAAFSLVLGLHWVDFHAVSGEGGRVMQGRYLLPLMPVAGVAVAAALTNFGARRAHAAGAVLAGMAAIQLLALATVAGRYFA
jgi:hypothetical protein